MASRSLTPKIPTRRRVPPGLTLPTGPRSSTSAQRKIPTGSIKVAKRVSRKAEDKTPIEVMPYKEAIDVILRQTGPYLTKLKTLSPTLTSVVLYDPSGAVIKAGNGILLKNDVSLCYLVTWLQIFTDNCVIKYLGGKEELLVKSIEIRFHNRQLSKTYPTLEGELCWSDADKTTVSSINWPCGNSPMEIYWESYRSLMQLGSDDHIKQPIFKVRTVKFEASEGTGVNSKKGFGRGHNFIVGNERLDVQRYSDYEGRSYPQSLEELDLLLAEYDKEKKAAHAMKKATQIRSAAAGVKGKNVACQQTAACIGQDAGYNQRIDENQKGDNTKENQYGAAQLAAAKLSGSDDPKDTAVYVPIRQVPSKTISVEIGNRTMDVTVPFRPPIHPDPEQNWARYQRSGGTPQIHNAFPLEHHPFNQNDMPDPVTPPSTSKGSDVTGTHSSQRGRANSEYNWDTADTLIPVPYDSKAPFENAIGFSSDDDYEFFPAGSSKNNTTSGDAVPVSKYMERYEQLRKNDSNNKGKGKETPDVLETYGRLSGPALADPTSFKILEQSSKMALSMMNVNAPEFVSPAFSTGPDLKLDSIVHPPAFSSYDHVSQPDVGFGSVTNYNMQLYASTSGPLVPLYPPHPMVFVGGQSDWPPLGNNKDPNNPKSRASRIERLSVDRVLKRTRVRRKDRATVIKYRTSWATAKGYKNGKGQL